ncbi:hypothetical protein PENARI_c054G00725 [Penicillium arizonense]|uniref:PAS domain-containing protein n=1 Tax=Penicillium arizonense TaxID=1835702 RepID=A0A1F5L1V2_PENAI|nr:hypothetical protein PENARI_c054G00725 [Penicillium arizonense]OGE47218.1 hypothetical protein PENARI_c054G00725 [Penicillium arizonense]
MSSCTQSASESGHQYNHYSELPHHDDINHYDINHYDINHYDINHYDINHYDINHYDHSANQTAWLQSSIVSNKSRPPLATAGNLSTFMSSLQQDTSQVGNDPCGVMLPGQDNQPRQIFKRPTVPLPTDLDAHLSNVTLTHGSPASTGGTMIDDHTAVASDELLFTCGMNSQKPSVPPVAPCPQYPHFIAYSRADPIMRLPPQPAAAAGISPATEHTQTTDKLPELTRSLCHPRSQERCTQEIQSRAGYLAPQTISIRPNTLAVKRPEVSGNFICSDASTHANIYSKSGFDILGILARAISRPNPKINVGPVDLSSALVVCDILCDDYPIVYVSEGFERLTGYTSEEVVGQNCRFLQGPDDKIEAGAKRRFVDEQTVLRMRSSIADRCEIQTSIINYRKDGQPFINLITLIPPEDTYKHRFQTPYPPQ